MNTKLTLSLNPAIISRAKAFARERQISLSTLVETLLLKVVADEAQPGSPSGTAVKSLTGIIRLDNTSSHGDSYQSYLEEKHQ